ncbi:MULTISPECIES: hypothetical protein [Corynebacterium]|uniref:hypothetical protein n=1 Tax=Corynebacterium TaxID=1716 RepID=UPI001865855A|nr:MULTISPECIES: hypothetical protein [Corynebacterium]
MHSNTWLRFIEGAHGGQHTTNTTADEVDTTTEASDDTDTDDTAQSQKWKPRRRR